jgi:hypothetical protein
LDEVEKPTVGDEGDRTDAGEASDSMPVPLSSTPDPGGYSLISLLTSGMVSMMVY